MAGATCNGYSARMECTFACTSPVATRHSERLNWFTGYAPGTYRVEIGYAGDRTTDPGCTDSGEDDVFVVIRKPAAPFAEVLVRTVTPTPGWQAVAEFTWP